MKLLQKLSNLLLASLMLFAATSCSNDDDNTSKEVVGTYDGYTSAKISYDPTKPILTDDEKVVITDNGNGTVKVIITSQQWGTGTINSATVTLNGSNYTLDSGKDNENDKMIVPSMKPGGSPSEWALTLNGTISKDKKTYELLFKMPLMGGTELTFKNGTAPSSSSTLKASYYLEKYVFNK